MKKLSSITIYFFFMEENLEDRRGGVGLVLSPRARSAWMLAGQPEPIKSGNVAKRERTIALELHYLV
jgi:hypothetical protein